ncbi:MAG: hypothetical protein KH111_19940, partial [Bacteroidales bacterium]|nr:hypothetical protein [Bacteroidales bacterium]
DAYYVPVVYDFPYEGAFVREPLSGFWQNVGYYTGIGGYDTYPGIMGDWKVSREGRLTGIKPIELIAPSVGIGKIGTIWTSTSKLTSTQNAFGHWVKHSKDFLNLQNAKQYVEATRNFLLKPPVGTLTKIRPNGDILRYNPSTNTFAIMNKFKIPRTMFKPTEGIKYWNRQ